MNFSKYYAIPPLIGGLIAILIFGLYFAVSGGLKGVAKLTGPEFANDDPALDWLIPDTEASTYTEQYLNEGHRLWPAPDQEQLTAFIAENSNPLFTPASASEFPVAPGRGPEAMQAYLDSISLGTNPDLRPVSTERMAEAFHLFINEGDSNALDAIITDLKTNEDLIRQLAVPVEAQTIHGKLLGVTQSLQGSLVLMKDLDHDYIGAIIGAHRAEQLASPILQLTKEIRNLESKYNI